MAYRRSITDRAKLLYQQQYRVVPSISHVHHRDGSDREELHTDSVCRKSEFRNYFHRRFLSTGNNLGAFYGSTNLFQDRRFTIPAGCGMVFGRNFSTGTVGDEAADKIDIFTAFGDKTLEATAQAAPPVNEVAVAAADSFFPVAALQHVIDSIHTFTGLPWWASIAVTTLVIRCFQLPLIINQMKASVKLAVIKPELEAIKEEMEYRGMSASAVAEGRAKMKSLFEEHGVSPFTPLRGLLISGPVFCCFFFAITNMAEKVASFKDGGMLWFTDLTIPDSMYVFPVLTGLTFWITVELNAMDGMEANPNAHIMKNVCRGFAAISIPLTASFPNAIFCYWITSNLYSLIYGITMKRPKVKAFLGIPDMPVTPPARSTGQESEFTFFGAIKKYVETRQKSILEAQQQQSLISPPSLSSSKPTKQRISSSSSVLNQKIKSLEKEVKGRKKGKKR